MHAVKPWHLLPVLFLATGCYVSVGAGATRPIKGDVQKRVQPSYTLALGFAWEFDRAFVALGGGGQTGGTYTTNADPDVKVAPVLLGEVRGDYTLKRSRIGNTPSFWVMRLTGAVAMNGCVGITGSGSMEEGCAGASDYTAFKAWSAISFGGAAPGLANLLFSIGPSYWQGGHELTGAVAGVGVEARITYHFSRMKGGAVFFGAGNKWSKSKPNRADDDFNEKNCRKTRGGSMDCRQR